MYHVLYFDISGGCIIYTNFKKSQKIVQTPNKCYQYMLLLPLALWNNPQGKQWAPPYIPFCIAWPQGHFQKRILPFLRRILTSMHSASAHWGRSPEKKTKTALLLDFVQMRGGGPCPNFFISAFLVMKRSLFPPK